MLRALLSLLVAAPAAAQTSGSVVPFSFGLGSPKSAYEGFIPTDSAAIDYCRALSRQRAPAGASSRSSPMQLQEECLRSLDKRTGRDEPR